jgi:hypothetical protein
VAGAAEGLGQPGHGSWPAGSVRCKRSSQIMRVDFKPSPQSQGGASANLGGCSRAGTTLWTTAMRKERTLPVCLANRQDRPSAAVEDRPYERAVSARKRTLAEKRVRLEHSLVDFEAARVITFSKRGYLERIAARRSRPRAPPETVDASCWKRQRSGCREAPRASTWRKLASLRRGGRTRRGSAG